MKRRPIRGFRTCGERKRIYDSSPLGFNWRRITGACSTSQLSHSRDGIWRDIVRSSKRTGLILRRLSAADLRNLMGAQFRLSAHFYSGTFCSFPTFACSYLDEFALKLASPPNTVSINRPPGVVVSHHGSARDLKRHPLSAMALMVVRRSMVERASDPSA